MYNTYWCVCFHFRRRCALFHLGFCRAVQNGVCTMLFQRVYLNAYCFRYFILQPLETILTVVFITRSTIPGDLDSTTVCPSSLVVSCSVEPNNALQRHPSRVPAGVWYHCCESLQLKTKCAQTTTTAPIYFAVYIPTLVAV